MHEEWESRTLPREENLEKVEIRLEWDESVWERKNERVIEREIEENDRRIAWGDYIGP